VLGDPISLPDELRDAPLSEVGRLFGEVFAARLEALPLDEWSGPIESGYGAHLVRIEQRVPGSPPTLDQVREAVLRDWQAAQVTAAQEAFYQSLRQGYTVEIERGDKKPGDAAEAESPR
jgi:parvulin-like peptidyl-prolyl isomerase